MDSILVTGGAGFIGSNFVLSWVNKGLGLVVNVDKLTYAGSLDNLASLKEREDHLFVEGNMGDEALLERLLLTHQPRAIINFAAQTHVDRSIHYPENFIETNILETAKLLKSALSYWKKARPTNFRFVHISTDEVYGSLTMGRAPFSESSPYRPSNPYSATKAASDHLVRAYVHTYGFPAITINCSNNYGPGQHLEKLIPLTIHHALSARPIPLYGDGQQIRDWLFVEDHCEALRLILKEGALGRVYHVGGNAERTNLQVVEHICRVLDKKRPKSRGLYGEQITFVKDRPGHDRRYAIEISQSLSWRPRHSFEAGVEKTIHWYLDNDAWVAKKEDAVHREWLEVQYP